MSAPPLSAEVSLSPTRRAWRCFRAHRLGFVSLVLFVALFALSLVAELVSNDKPLLVRYDLAGVAKALTKQALSQRTPDLWRYRELLPVRDPANIVAYTLGAWHFHPRSEWLATFEQAGFELVQETKNNLLITTFILRKHGTAS